MRPLSSVELCDVLGLGRWPGIFVVPPLALRCRMYADASWVGCGMQVRWDLGLSGRRVAYFMFPKEESEVKMMAGDEMRLRLPGDSQRAAWEAMGHVVR